ncbi:hypothetical protein CBO05C_0370 [Clostridium botulinum B str. Osaka05]|uniref:DUF5085 domain-containing protein n=1 Tax=Clostridium botulinum B str. Osaka05 TaxID=1407017 RepID=A0A0S6U1Q5_CLOBO|nr:DUF5085 family protein [Clostridium botulinum]GAE00680.1 hypothetical protein CBO05C_0370 [Clostridium botulinum B str. Osaka05]
MINTHDYIRLTNTISRKYYFNYRDFENVMKEFLNNISDLKVNITGFQFYSINMFATINENVGMEFFISVKENYVDVPKDMNFHSYFSIENMIFTTVFNNYEKNTEEEYSRFKKFMEENKLEQTTPFFNVISGDDTLQYAFLKVMVSSTK